jgi:hypothetical protein
MQGAYMSSCQCARATKLSLTPAVKQSWVAEGLKGQYHIMVIDHI